MNKKELILWNQTKCTITEEADLDIPENFYFQWEDALKAMQAYLDQVIAERIPEKRDALDIGFQYNENKLENIAQCLVDDIFGQGYLLALEHLKSLQENQTEDNH